MQPPASASLGMPDPEQLPLTGVRVLDFSRLLPGPFCSQVLVDLGAEVIRVDDATRNDGGDLMRQEAQLDGFGDGEFFHLVNRGKKSIALNLRDPRAVEIVKQLVVDVDIVLEGFRPGVMQRLGVGYSALSAVRPELVYCAISGYGQSGSFASQAGHDLNYQALSGTLHHSRPVHQPPAVGGLQIADLAGGAMTAVSAILAALLEAKLKGKGRFLDVSMTDGLLALNVYTLGLLSLRSQEPKPGQELITGGAACYQLYPTQDGRWLAVGALEQKFWVRFCNVIGRPDLAELGHSLGDVGQATIRAVSAEIIRRPLADWREIFAPEDCCVTPVLTLEEALRDGPAAQRPGIWRTPEGRLRSSFPVSMQSTEQQNPLRIPAQSPEIGSHSRALLRAAGYREQDIDQLMEAGVAR